MKQRVQELDRPQEETKKKSTKEESGKNKKNLKSLKIKGYTPFKVHAGKAIP